MLPWHHWVSDESSQCLKLKAYKFILKVTKLPTIYRFSTAEETTWAWVDSAPPPHPSRLIRANNIHIGGMIKFRIHPKVWEGADANMTKCWKNVKVI